jgi:hypothetical protein
MTNYWRKERRQRGKRDSASVKTKTIFSVEQAICAGFQEKKQTDAPPQFSCVT